MMQNFLPRPAPNALVVSAFSVLAWLFCGGSSQGIQAVAFAAERAGVEAGIDEGRRHVAGLWAGSAWRLVEAGEYRRAAQAFAVARDLVPQEASYWVGIGLSQLGRFRDDLAMSALERAIEIDPHVTQAHVLLGDIYAQRGEVTAAVRYYDRALSQNPNDVAVQERLLLARRGDAYEATFDRLFSAHFIVKFQGAADRALATEVAERLETAYDEVGRTLGYFPDETVTVLLYPAKQFQAATLSPGWTNALFDGRIHLPIERLTQASGGSKAQGQGITRMLKHELAHAVVHRLSRGLAPAWLSEGLALYCEGMSRSRSQLAQDPEVREPLRSLHGSFLNLPPKAAAAAYEESYGATQVLIQRHGILRVRQLLETLPVTPDFPRAFEALFHERYRDFDETWALSQAGPQGGKKG